MTFNNFRAKKFINTLNLEFRNKQMPTSLLKITITHCYHNSPQVSLQGQASERRTETDSDQWSLTAIMHRPYNSHIWKRLACDYVHRK